VSATFGTEPVGDEARGRVVLVEYDPSWPLRYAAERARLAGALGERAVAIEHIGSTAVPGLAGESAVDVAVALPDLVTAADAVPRLQQLGYERVPTGDYGGRFFLRRQSSPTRAYHLSLSVLGAEFWRLHLLFRDRLRADPMLAREYADLKRRLAADPGDRERYTAGKADFIQRSTGQGWNSSLALPPLS
jgi:GrpB-like predicted nucleotidyltransferase (UPF0157 family)